jgi:hypothetical protein
LDALYKAAIESDKPAFDAIMEHISQQPAQQQAVAQIIGDVLQDLLIYQRQGKLTNAEVNYIAAFVLPYATNATWEYLDRYARERGQAHAIRAQFQTPAASAARWW